MAEEFKSIERIKKINKQIQGERDERK